MRARMFQPNTEKHVIGLLSVIAKLNFDTNIQAECSCSVWAYSAECLG